METGWELTSISCVGDEGQGNASGADPDANANPRTALFDVQAGEDITCTFNNREDSSVKFVKQTNPDGSSTVFDFTSATNFNDLTLSDGQDSGATKVTPGTYRVQEAVEQGWELTGISCTGDEGQGNASGADPDTNTHPRTARFDVQAGEDIVCTFNNRENSSIKFVKQTDPDGSSKVFTFTSAQTFNDNTLSDGQDSGATTVLPGTYRVQEGEETGWDLTSIQCSGDVGQSNLSGADPDTNANPRTALFDVQAGENITCTFNNREDSSIKFVKQTNPDGSSTVFDFTSATSFNDLTLSDGQDSGATTVLPGTYRVQEQSETGWELTDISCTGDEGQGNASGTDPDTATHPRTALFNVQAGEDITCTFSNREDSSVKFVKQTNPDGSSTVFDFTSATNFNDTTLSDGQDSGATKVTPGTYRVQEGVETGWDLTSISCVGDEGQGNASGADPDQNNPRTALFDVQAGEDITCTFNNREKSSIKFVKQTNPDGSPAVFSFTTAETFNDTTLSDGQDSGATTVTPGTYRVQEDLKQGWELTGISCVGDEGQGSAVRHRS